MARIFGAALCPETAFHTNMGPSGNSFWTLQNTPVVFSVSSGSAPAPQTISGSTPGTTLATLHTSGGSQYMNPNLGVWLAIAVAGGSTWQLALEADIASLDGIIGVSQYAIIRRIFKYGSVPFQQG